MESDGEIEYLEEDAEIVQQCVQLSKQETKPKPRKPLKVVREQLIKKSQVHKPSIIRKRTIKTQQHDSETDDNAPALKKQANLRTYPKAATTKESLSYSAKQSYLARKKLNIRIPDYGDPLCLPVRAVKLNGGDVKRLNNWNKVCLEHFKTADVILKPESGETKSSVRTAIFKNVNNQSGNTETKIWSKTSVENTNGDKKSEIFQCVLPRYKEKNSLFFLNNYLLGNRKLRYTRTVDEVLITKEDHKDGEALVVYKPKESLTAVYGLIDKRAKGEELKTKSNEESNLYLKELTCSKICAPCYQTSWRGINKTNRKSSLVCPICGRTFVSIYNLLAHFKAHSATDVHKYGRIISTILSSVVGYHYKCRICRMKFDSIKNLRIHVKSHQTPEYFKCEIGNHMVNY